MKLMFADIETTGFSRDWDTIIEIAAIIVDENFNEIERFHEYINPGKPVPAKITEITGITDDMLFGKRDEESALLDFFLWVRENNPDAVVGHNYIAFDGQFFDTKALKYDIPKMGIEVIDTLKIAREKKIPVKARTATGRVSYKQEALAAHYGIDYQAHSAIEDVRALIQIYKSMTSPEQNIKQAREELGF